MASAKNEAKILFKAETAEFESSLKSAQSEMSSLRAEMKLAEATFKATGDAAEYQKSKTEILESQLEANAQKQEALTQKLEAAKAIYGEDSEEVAKLERALTNAKTEEQNLTAQLKDTNSGLGEQKEAAEEAGDKMQGLSEVIVAAGIADKLQEIGQAAYDMAAEFDEASAAVVEGTGASGEALDELNEAAQNAFGSLANDSGSIGDVANTLAELNTRFGLTGDAAEDATVKFSNFADHTGTDGVKAVDSIANIMHRWGMDIDDLDPLLDDLTTANQSCQMSVDDLTGYLANNSTQFQELGYSSDEALAMLISLSDGGADVGSVMSGLTKGIANLSGETDDVPGAFQAAVKAISESGSVSEALQQQVGDTGKTVEEVFGKKAAQELATNIQNGSFAVDKWKTALENNDGALQSTTENATTMSDSWSQAVNNVQMALGTTFAPAIQAVVTALANFITPIAQFIQQSPIAQAAIVGIATVLGILGAALAIGAIIQGVTAALSILGATMAIVGSPVLIVVAIITALVAALIYAWHNCETFRNGVTTAFNIVRNVVVAVVTTLGSIISTVFNAIRSVVVSIVTAVGTKISSVWSAIQRTTTTVWNAIRNGITKAITTAKNTVSTVVGAVKSKVSSVWNGIKSATTSAWNAIKTHIVTPITNAKTTASNVVTTIKTKVTSVFNAVKTTVKTAWENIKKTISDAITKAKETVSNMVEAIKGFFNLSDLISKVKSTFDDIKEKMTKPITDAKEKISGIISDIKGKFPFSLGKLIKFKLPKVSVTKGEFGVPHFSVSWNARGAVFRRPVIFGSPAYGLQGFGEAGPEVAAPLDTITGILEDAARRGNPEIDYDRLGTSVAKACAKMNVSIEFEKRTLGRVVRGLA